MRRRIENAWTRLNLKQDSSCVPEERIEVRFFGTGQVLSEGFRVRRRRQKSEPSSSRPPKRIIVIQLPRKHPEPGSRMNEAALSRGCVHDQAIALRGYNGFRCPATVLRRYLSTIIFAWLAANCR
jgi:hypothetical protein